MCECACVCVCVSRGDQKSKAEVGLRPRWEEPIHLAKEFKFYQDNEATSQDFKQNNSTTYVRRVVEAMSLWPWELNCVEP